MKHAVWTQEHVVRSFLADGTKRLGLTALLDLLQDAAWEHATHLGHGHEAMLAEQLIWVLVRQKVAVQRWPAWGTTVHLRTWVRPTKSSLALRDFELLSDGEVVGVATTSWLLVDATTRRPSRRSVADLSVEFRHDRALDLEAPKLAPRADLVERLVHEVRRGDLDLNRHVNNVRYARWSLDALPDDGLGLAGYEVNFLAEARAGDRITIRTSDPGPGWVDVQGVRAADAKVVFAARLELSRRA